MLIFDTIKQIVFILEVGITSFGNFGRSKWKKPHVRLASEIMNVSKTKIISYVMIYESTTMTFYIKNIEVILIIK